MVRVRVKVRARARTRARVWGQVLDLEQQRRLLRVEPRDLVVLPHLVGEGVVVEVLVCPR